MRFITLDIGICRHCRTVHAERIEDTNAEQAQQSEVGESAAVQDVESLQVEPLRQSVLDEGAMPSSAVVSAPEAGEAGLVLPQLLVRFQDEIFADEVSYSNYLKVTNDFQ